MTLLRDRFAGTTSADMAQFSCSLHVDMRMLDEDIDGSVAHACMLGETGILTHEEARVICAGLEQVREDIRSGAFVASTELEDVHMAVETRLGQLVGDVAKKLHTARSRNDQVATDVRLWLKKRLVELDDALQKLISSLLERVEKDGRALMPGFTHLQRGQPIFLGHHLLAHAWALSRDRERVADAMARVDRSPLGACAMAGTPHPIDRDRTAQLLGFAQVLENAMDAVSARDHEQEVACDCAIIMTHLSRMAEELVLWSSREFALVQLSDAYSTGSSIMPQKRNPDAAELVRGKAARVYGDLQALLVMCKGLPLAYNRDLQEDREALFDAVDTTLGSTLVLAGVWSTLDIHRERYATELEGDFSLATELADALVGQGVAFREAHQAVARLIATLEAERRDLRGITITELRRFHSQFPDDIASYLDPRLAAERRTSRGGTAWSEIERQLHALRATLKH